MKKYSLYILIIIPIVLILGWLGYIQIKNFETEKDLEKSNAETVVINQLKDKNLLEGIGSCSYGKGVLVYINEGIPFYVENDKLFLVNAPKTGLLNEIAASLIKEQSPNYKDVDYYFLYEDCLPEASKYVEFYDKYIKK